MAIAAAGLVLAFAAACGGGGSSPVQSTPPPGDQASATPRGPAAAEACVTDAVAGPEHASMTGAHEWAPSEFTVSVGTSVTWTNDTTAPHTLTFATGPDCGYVLGGDTVSITFDTPGTFGFKCRIHPNYMTGTVTVS